MTEIIKINASYSIEIIKNNYTTKDSQNKLIFNAFKIYKGKKNNKDLNKYYYSTEEQRQKAIDEIIKQYQNTANQKTEIKEKEKIKKQENINNLKVWDVLVNSWWFEQTNINAFQIIEKKGSKIKLKEIKIKYISETSYCSDRVEPIKNNFLENWEEMEKIINQFWVNFKFWSCDIWNWLDSYHRSYWY